MILDRLYADDQRSPCGASIYDPEIIYTYHTLPMTLEHEHLYVPQPETYDSYLTYKPQDTPNQQSRIEVTSPKHLEAIKKWIDEECLTIRGLAKTLDISHESLRLYLNGQVVMPERVKQRLLQRCGAWKKCW